MIKLRNLYIFFFKNFFSNLDEIKSKIIIETERVSNLKKNNKNSKTGSTDFFGRFFIVFGRFDRSNGFINMFGLESVVMD